MGSNYEEDERIIELFWKLDRINNQLGEEEGSFPALMTVHKKRELEAERDKLANEFENLLIEVDRIEIRNAPAGKKQVIMQRLMLDSFFDLRKMWDTYYDEILDFHQQTELLDRYKFLENYYKLTPPYVQSGVKIPQGIKDICHESRWSFVYGQYSASISLSRTVVETILKNRFNLEGKLKEIIETAKQKKFISNQSAWKANKVRVLANRVLHEARPSTEEEAKNALDHVLNFMEEIYLENA